MLKYMESIFSQQPKFQNHGHGRFSTPPYGDGYGQMMNPKILWIFSMVLLIGTLVLGCACCMFQIIKMRFTRKAYREGMDSERMDSNDCYVIENKPPSARSENNWENNSEDILHEESESMQQIPDTNHSESGSYYEPQPSDQQYQLDMMYT